MKIRYLHIDDSMLVVDDTYFDLSYPDLYEIFPDPESRAPNRRINLSITAKKESEWNETVFMNNQSMKDALEYLLSKMFGDRSRNVINCKTLSMGDFIPILPELVRFHTKNLILTDAVPDSDDLNRVLVPTCFPLESINLCCMYLENEMEYPIVQQSKLLILSLDLNFHEEEYGDLNALTHSRIHFYRDYWNSRNIERLLVSWKENQKPIGTHFSFERPTVAGMRRLLRNIGDRFPESRIRKIGNKR